MGVAMSKTTKKVRRSPKKPVKRTSARKSTTPKPRATPRSISRYVVQVDTVKGIGYLAAWDRKGGPQFDSDVSNAIKGGDSNLMWHFASAIAERKPRGVKSVDVIPMGDVKKN